MHKWLFALIVLCLSCQQQPSTIEQKIDQLQEHATITTDNASASPTVPPSSLSASTVINTGTTTPAELVAFSKTLIGTPYLYGSIDRTRGFDCSGFITYVFNHFDISVPRSSSGFTEVQRQVPLDSATIGDLILFTGTDSTVPEVGHMGIVVSNGRPLEFIHSTSGKAYGVTITPLNQYYMSRFVKVVRVF
jgi:cell wall-associated NlpC family hydrolase